MKKKKRFVIIFKETTKNSNIIKTKTLFKTNYYWLAKLYFQDRVTIFKDFVINRCVEVVLYDKKSHNIIMKCEYFLNKCNKND